MDDLMRKDLSALLVSLVVGILYLYEPSLLLRPIVIPILALAALGIWVALRPMHAGPRSYLFPVGISIVIGLASITLFGF